MAIFVGLIVVVGGLYVANVFGILPGGTIVPTGDGDDEEQTDTVNSFAQIEVAFDFESIDLAAQDSQSDYDHDTFEWTPEINEDLVDKHYVDCSGATPVAWSGGADTVVTVPDSAMCQVNFYKFTQSFTAADVETSIEAKAPTVKADLQDWTVANNASTTYKFDNTKTYMTCSIDTSEYSDLIPSCFLWELPTATTLDTDSVAGGDVEVVFKRKHYSDAQGESRVTISGTCSDSEDNDVTLSSGLDGMLHSSLTTAVTNWDTDCTVEVEVNKDGYKLIMDNPLADGETEKAYIQFEPYGANWNDTTNSSWGKVANTDSCTTYFSSTRSSTAGNYTIWESMVGCGSEITDDDTAGTGSLVHANEKIRSASCFKDLADKGDYMEIDVSISNVASVDYDASTSANNTILEANSGSSAEDVVDISMFGPLNTSSDIVGQVLTA